MTREGKTSLVIFINIFLFTFIMINFDSPSYTPFNDIDKPLIVVIKTMYALRRQVETLDFKKLSDRQLFIKTLLGIRMSYKNAERYNTGKDSDPFTLPVINERVAKVINKKQVISWLNKLILNIENYLSNPGNDSYKQLKFIQDQFPLIDVTVKVINGTAYFSGI